MEPAAIAAAILALVVLAVRAPLLVAPLATVRLFRSFITSNLRVRMLGACLALLGALLLRATRGESVDLVWVLHACGWLLAVVGVWLLLLPAVYRRLAETVLDAINDPAVLRALGAIGVAIGLFLGWLAIRVF